MKFCRGIFAIVGAALIVVWHVLPASADTLIAGAVEQSFELQSKEGMALCTWLTQIASYPAPEVVNVRYSVGSTGGKNGAFSSFRIDVGDLSFMNGLPSGLTEAKIISSTISNQDFSTDGIYTTIPSGTGMLGFTKDLSQATKLLFAVAGGGEFFVSFQREGAPTSRTYRVRPETDDIASAKAQMLSFKKFQGCMSSLLPPPK